MIETTYGSNVGPGNVAESLHNRMSLNTKDLTKHDREMKHLVEYERNILRFYASNYCKLMHPFCYACI